MFPKGSVLKLAVILLVYFNVSLITAGPLLGKEDNTYEWDLISQVNVSGALPVYKYKSRRTGFTVVISQAESPIVNGYICLATEAFNNDGLPHTLEHLVFLGSEDYPYKEVLDLMANRCLADRTNAWTDTDHTCYTVYTAGSGGFLNILPVYMDHILYPLLRDEDFMTEVHHISAHGEDAGVVYSEMQGVENKASNIIYFQMIHLLYPGNNSYISQTGGKLKNLREETTIEKVRAYHKKFYRPENLYITVTGNIKAEQVFKALDQVEKKILSKREKELEPYIRPFQTPLEPLKEDVKATLRYPSKDEMFGSVSMGWRIPGPLWEVIPTVQALSILTAFMSSSPISPLQQHFVELPVPLATDVDISILLNSEVAVTMDFENVPLDKMELIDEKFRLFMEDIKQKGSAFIDMTRIHTIIERMMLAHQMNLENSPHMVVPDPAVLDMLYSQSPDHFELFLRKVDQEVIDRLMNKSADFWMDLLIQTFSTPKVLLLAYPSEEHDSQLMMNETLRTAKQIEDLGEEGLEKAAAKIEAAVKSQRLPPSDVLLSVPVADASSISFKPFVYYNYTTEAQPVGFNLRGIPFRFHVDNTKSHFVRFYIFFDTSHLSKEDLPYLVLLNTLWLQCPLKHAETGVYETLEEIIMRRSRDTLSVMSNIGYKGATFVPGSHSHLLMFFVEAQIDKYIEAVTLLKQTLNMVEFTEERARTVISQLLNSIPGEKLSGAKVVNSISDGIFFNNKSNLYYTGFLRQQKYLRNALQALDHNPGQLIGKLHEIRKSLLRPDNSFAFLTADLEKLEKLVGDKNAGVWIDFFPEGNETTKEDLATRFKTISESVHINPNPPMRHAIVGLQGSDSCHLKQGVQFEIVDWENPEIAAVRVMLQYMTDRMYDKIRGKGWTYGVSMSASVTEGRIRVNFVRSSHITDAYKEFRAIILNYTDSGNSTDYIKQWDPVLLDSAKGSQIYSWAEREETTEDLSSVSVKSYLRGTTDPYYNRRFVKLLADTTLEDVRKAALKYLPRFLDSKQSQTSIVCSPPEVTNIKYIFGHFDLDLVEVVDLENSILTE